MFSIQYMQKEKVTSVEAAESTSNKGKRVKSLGFCLMRFGWDLHIIISRSMEKTLKKSGVKAKKGKKENSLLVQRG